jgi:hypothetical protein
MWPHFLAFLHIVLRQVLAGGLFVYLAAAETGGHNSLYDAIQYMIL